MGSFRQRVVFACLGVFGALGPLATAQMRDPFAPRNLLSTGPTTQVDSTGAWNPVVAWTVDEATGLMTINIRSPGRQPIAGGRVDNKPFGSDPYGRRTLTHQLSPGPYRFAVTVRDDFNRVFEQWIVGTWRGGAASAPSRPSTAEDVGATPPSIPPAVATVGDWKPSVTWKVDDQSGALTVSVDSVDGSDVASVLINGFLEPGAPSKQRAIVRQLVPGVYRFTVVASNAKGQKFQQSVSGVWQQTAQATPTPSLAPIVTPVVTTPAVMVAESKWEPRVEWELNSLSGELRVTVTTDGKSAIASLRVAGVEQGGAKDGNKSVTYKVKPGDFNFPVSVTDVAGRTHNQQVVGTWKAPAPPAAVVTIPAPAASVTASTIAASSPSSAKVMPAWQPDINWTLDAKAGVVSVTVDSVDGRPVNAVLIDGMDVGGNAGLKRALSRGVAPGEFSFVVSAVDSLGQVANRVVSGTWKLAGRVSGATNAVANVNYAKSVFALVIGNSKYSFGPLENPKNDANAIAKKLRDFGYDVEVVFDASRNQIVEALSASLSRAEKADVNLLYYAGHGVQINGVNYLIPTDVSLTNTETLQFSAVKISEIIDNFMPAKTRLVFLDACRDNPLARSLRRSRNAAGAGLAAMDVASGTLISYATKDGSVALDNAGASGGNSPYAKALLEHLGEPLDITLVLRKVRQKVLDDTNNQQIPWDYGSLTGSELILGRAPNP